MSFIPPIGHLARCSILLQGILRRLTRTQNNNNPHKLEPGELNEMVAGDGAKFLAVPERGGPAENGPGEGAAQGGGSKPTRTTTTNTTYTTTVFFFFF